MGMAASQARFLGLTARKTNVEYEGQQINQQRTALSNQSANYYNDLLGMSVPVPPSVDNFTKTVYTFEDGALKNQITAMIAQPNGQYTLSYLSKWQEDFAVVAAASSVVTRSGGNYMVGAATLRELGKLNTNPPTSNPQITIDGVPYNVKKDDNGYYIEKTSTVESTVLCTPQEINNLEYYLYDDATDDLQQLYKDNGGFSYIDDTGKLVPKAGVVEDDLIISWFDSTQTNPEYAVCFVTKDASGNYQRQKYEEKTEKQYLTPPQIESLHLDEGNNDPYLDSLTADELRALKSEEEMYLALLKQEYGANTEWLVRYVQDSSTGKPVPYFYKKSDLDTADYDQNGNSRSNINCYTVGSKQRVQEFKAIKNCLVESDTSGRFISISIPNNDGSGTYTTYPLTTSTETDQDAYTDAMNKYEHEKYLYDQSIQNINSKIEIVQFQDKNLELRLKQLDTEQSAISTEMDSVSKVIEKNTESTFKTFG